MSKINFARPGTACGSRDARPEELYEISELPGPTASRPHLALVSSRGREIDLHLGEAARVLIYGPDPDENGALGLLWVQNVPEPGGGGLRWQTLAESLTDCFAVVAAGAGANPQRILADHGLPLLIAQGEVGAVVRQLYRLAQRTPQGE